MSNITDPANEYDGVATNETTATSSSSEDANPDHQPELVCCVCKKSFLKKCAFISHNKWAHKEERIRKTSSYCDLCGKTFSCLSTLRSHFSRIHESSEKRALFACPICHSLHRKQAMEQHFKNTHSIVVERETILFSNFSEFLEWKEDIQRRTRANYKKCRKTYKSIKNEKTSFYVCHRDGHYKPEGYNVRRMKRVGSNKLNAHCPARMVVKERTDSVHVVFTKTHVGHTMDLERLTMSKKEREMIAQKLSMQIPMDEILNELKNSDSPPSRLSLLTKKDLRNIITTHQLNQKVLSQQFDFDAVDEWISQLQGTSINMVRFCKGVGAVVEELPELGVNDFILILANDYQLEMLAHHGNNLISIDWTNPLNNYEDVEMYSVQVINPFDECFPCAFLFTNRRDQFCIQLFFKVIRGCITCDLLPDYFMSDLTGDFYQAWCAGVAKKPIQLHTSWEVDEKLRDELLSVKSKEKKADIYKKLNVLMIQGDAETFDIMVKNLSIQLAADSSTEKFPVFFESFVQEPTTWAHCYRNMGGVQASDNIDAMHKQLKKLFLLGKKSKLLQQSVIGVMKFVKSLFYKKLTLDAQGLSDILSSDFHSRHFSSLKLDVSSVISTKEFMARSWHVPSSNLTTVYEVKMKQSGCECGLRCDSCMTCIHEFECSCWDCTLCWNMCKHIHLVSRSISDEDVTTKLDVSNSSPVVTDIDFTNQSIVYHIVNEDGDNLSSVECVDKSDLVKQFALVVNKIKTAEELEIATKHIQDLENALEYKKTLPGNTNQGTKRSASGTSSKKKHSRLPPLKKPTAQESIEIALNLVM